MQKHTPGPWTFDQTWALINGPKGEEIAAIHAAQDGTRRVHPQTAHANARLIAAAPALLEALEGLCGYQEQLCDYEQEPPSDEVETNVWTAARAAIAAARGDK